MPTIKTVKPAGGGDYLTLQAWWDNWASQQATADQWAECYDGNMGSNASMYEPSQAPDASNYYRIYAAEGHSPTIDTADIFLDWLQIEGITFNGGSGYSLYVADSGGVIIDRCTFLDLFEFQPGTTAVSTVKNCVCKCAGAYAGMLIDNNTGSTILFNNTIVLKSGEFAYHALVIENTPGATHTVENNLCFGPGDVDTGAIITDNSLATIVSNYNWSDDATADDAGGTNHHINVDPLDVFTDYANGDYTLKEGSLAIDAGKTIPTVTVDYLGVTRPQGIAYDVGAYEYPQAPPPPPSGSPRWPTALARRNRFATPGRPAP